jgi:hypothetical protein
VQELASYHSVKVFSRDTERGGYSLMYRSCVASTVVTTKTSTCSSSNIFSKSCSPYSAACYKSNQGFLSVSNIHNPSPCDRKLTGCPNSSSSLLYNLTRPSFESQRATTALPGICARSTTPRKNNWPREPVPTCELMGKSSSSCH